MPVFKKALGKIMASSFPRQRKMLWRRNWRKIREKILKLLVKIDWILRTLLKIKLGF